MQIFPRNFPIVALVLVCFFQCRAQQEPASRAEEVKSGAITGRVFNDTGQPLVGATVTIRSAGSWAYVGRTAQTDAEGSFKVSDLDSGLYYVSAFSPAFVSAPSDQDESAPMYRVGDSVRLELIRGGVITGTVTNGNGEPVVAVRIRALLVKDATGKEVKGRFAGGERETDDRGIYRIFGLPPGTYIVLSGGGSGTQYNSLNATEFDAPTYAPSSTRDTASEIQVRSGEEATVDIRYRYEQGHLVSGTVRTTATNGVSVILAQATGSLTPIINSYQPNGAKGFAFNGIADGDYTVSASEVLSPTSNAFPDMAVSDPLRISVRGGDVTGIELVPKSLSSISGRIALEIGKLPECQNKRQPAFNETMISLIQNKKDSQVDQLVLMRSIAGVSIPDKDGAFVLKNLRPGHYTFSPRFFARYWYLKSISFASAQASTAKGPGLTKDAAKSWSAVKPGDRLSGLTITLSEGAASIKGRIGKDQAVTGMRIYLVPSERDKADDPFRYFVVEAGGDGTFTMTNLPPGKYWTLGRQAPEDIPTTTERLRLPDSLEARTKLRRAAEAVKSEIELMPCQNLTDLAIRPN